MVVVVVVVVVIEGSLEAKLPTIWRDENAVAAQQKLRDGESQKREDAGARKGRKVAKHCVSPVFCGSGGSKSRLAKAAGAETSGQGRKVKLARRCGAKHILKSKVAKHVGSRTTFGS